MQVPSHMQWWSNLMTQLLQTLQCEERTGLKMRQVSQYLNLKSRGECTRLT